MGKIILYHGMPDKEVTPVFGGGDDRHEMCIRDRIKIDLITGFLGAGKTTFLKKYVAYWMKQGKRISILENDFGAINVDMPVSYTHLRRSID